MVSLMSMFLHVLGSTVYSSEFEPYFILTNLETLDDLPPECSFVSKLSAVSNFCNMYILVEYTSLWGFKSQNEVIHRLAHKWKMPVPSCSFSAVVVTIVIQHCFVAVLSCAKKEKK